MNNQEERVQTYEGFQDRARAAMKRVVGKKEKQEKPRDAGACLLYTSPSPRDS